MSTTGLTSSTSLEFDGLRMAIERLFHALEERRYRGCMLVKNAPQALTTGVAHAISWTSAKYDTDGFWDISDPALIKVPPDVPAGALLEFRAQISLDSDPGAEFSRLEILKNISGTFTWQYYGYSVRDSYVQSLFAGGGILVSDLIPVSPGDEFRLDYRHSKGSTINVVGSTVQDHLTARLHLGP